MKRLENELDVALIKINTDLRQSIRLDIHTTKSELIEIVCNFVVVVVSIVSYLCDNELFELTTRLIYWNVVPVCIV